jgi:L-fuculose-phosphate aldolase
MTARTSGAPRLARDIVEIGRRLYAKGLIASTEGNISARSGRIVYVTPSGSCKGFLKPGEIVKVPFPGGRTSGRPSMELPMHLAVYGARDDVGAVVHAHPTVATGFAVAGIALDRPMLAEGVVTLGPVPLIAYATPSTASLAEGVARAIASANGVLLGSHGALTVGRNLHQAWERMETLEQIARVTLVARILGREAALPDGEVERLLALSAP